MRVIGGNARGRRLKVPKGQTLRPTAARVKEALFNILPHDLSGTKVLDLFAGTGNVTIEALSRWRSGSDLGGLIGGIRQGNPRKPSSTSSYRPDQGMDHAGRSSATVFSAARRDLRSDFSRSAV